MESGDASHEQFKPYEAKLREGVEIWYEFIQLYYRCLPIFTRFIQNPEHRLNLLQLLQGDVYDRDEVPVLEAMRTAIEAIEASESHLLKGALQEV